MPEKNSILEKLDGLESRFEEISTLITDPDVIADQKRYVQLTKEYKDLKELMDKRQEYIILTGNIAEAEEIIKDDKKIKKIFEEWLWDTVETGYEYLETEEDVKEWERMDD